VTGFSVYNRIGFVMSCGYGKVPEQRLVMGGAGVSDIWSDVGVLAEWPSDQSRGVRYVRA